MNISQYFRTDNLTADMVEIVVTLPTYNRAEQVLETLRSVEAQSITARVAVVVMDNHEAAAGAESASKYLKNSRLEGLVILAHDRGNCHAYNAGWQTALDEFPNFKWLAVIDDDEVASQDWLSNLVDMADRTGADLVGGPQIQKFGPDAPDHMKRHPVFEPHYNESGSVPILYSSGNVLISRAVLDVMPAPFLEPMFNFIGGGDSDFYNRCRQNGFSFAWCSEAPVYEDVPSQRTTFRWVNARSLRNGAISAMIETREHGKRHKTIFKTLLMFLASPLRSLRLAVKKRSFVIGLYHMQVAVGRILLELGVVNEQYRNPEAN